MLAIRGFAHFVGPTFICLVSEFYKQRIEELLKVVDVAGFKVIAPIAGHPFSKVVRRILLSALPASRHALKCVQAHDFSNDGFVNSTGDKPQLCEDLTKFIFGILNQILKADFADVRS